MMFLAARPESAQRPPTFTEVLVLYKHALAYFSGFPRTLRVPPA